MKVCTKGCADNFEKYSNKLPIQVTHGIPWFKHWLTQESTTQLLIEQTLELDRQSLSARNALTTPNGVA
jgi:hypothetical protein